MTEKYDKDNNGENGHGTSCASTIKREFNDVEIFVVKVLGKMQEQIDKYLRVHLVRRHIIHV
ncbi:hypothetical protein Q2T46_05985 [Thermoanaerobacterium sp. CMT5567-10]|uniref:hypothetical protein n=1 Tax=Thermoanaerobacterium sp. CMT5567-10 TaxID=3061989 RepID=UPI0026DEEA1F|nr:hypothetical protein [Thermoanaerobacterium sp. CMT5567-10]WKV09161.1 hypothetical protein Q2T46_01480 [Thermoanaerobacterium sp. CMT5567-10]WKV09979.1 hypothetical protein Q2T46_05985 [Thermoanaerobacterium sp. CMT5567-10]